MQEYQDMLDVILENEEKITEKQKKILEAAIEIFSEKGFASTSTSEIAKRAGVAEGTIFRHYRTKKELLLAIVGPVMSKIAAPFVTRGIHKLLDTEFDSFTDLLRAIIHNRQEFLRNNMPLFKIFVQEISFHPELKDQFFQHVSKQLANRMFHIIKSYQEKGQLIDLPPKYIFQFILSVIFGHLIARNVLFPDKNWDDEKDIDIMIQLIMNGIGKKF
jgi:AcrR family transcriptional regulator